MPLKTDPFLSQPQLLGACANLMAQCDDAKRQAVELFDVGDGQKPTSLADRALRLAFRNTSPASTTRLALAPLAALVTEPVAKRWLLRSAFLQNVVAGIETAVTRRDTTRLVCLLRALADVAGGGGDDGRREVLRVGGSSLVQLLIETLAQGKYCISQIPRLSDDTILTLFFKTQAGLGGGREGDDDDEDDVDVILAGVAAAGVDDAVFRPQLPAAVLEALLLLRNVCFHRYVFPIYQIPPADCPYETDTFFFISQRSQGARRKQPPVLRCVGRRGRRRGSRSAGSRGGCASGAGAQRPKGLRGAAERTAAGETTTRRGTGVPRGEQSSPRDE